MNADKKVGFYFAENGVIEMAEGLRPHYHQYFEYRTDQRYDESNHAIVKKVQYMCMICGKVRFEKYITYLPPPKKKDKSKVLERNKQRHKE